MRRLFVLFVLLVPVLAACDQTDREFGEEGLVRLPFEPERLLDSHGSMGFIALGERPGREDVEVARIAHDGAIEHGVTLPASFRPYGFAATLVDRGVRDPDLVTYVASHSQVVALAGTSFDPTFGDRGVVELGETMQTMAIGATWGGDGVPDVFVVGEPATGNGLRLVHIRDGEVASKVTIDDPLTEPFQVVKLFVDGDHLVLAGAYGRFKIWREGPSDTDVALLKVDRQGNPVRSFGEGGLARVSTNRTETVSDVVRRGDGRFVVAGYTFDDDDQGGAIQLVGLTKDGKLDGSFGLYARSIIGPLPALTAPQLLEYPGGFLVATSEDSTVITRRTDANGVFDDGWGDGGRQLNDVGRSTGATDIGFVNGTCLHRACNDDDARIVVSGVTHDPDGGVLVGLNP